MRLRKAADTCCLRRGAGQGAAALRGLPPAWASVSHFSAYYLA